MNEHDRNVRDIGWTLRHHGQFRAACLAKQRNDLCALKESFTCYGAEDLATRFYARFVASQSGAIAEFLAGEAS